jgi:hypothetical protein
MYGVDLTYGEEHRRALPELYGRIGHRLDMADRDWTEFCHYCKQPLAIMEEVQDRGQDLLDKGISVTRHLAMAARLPGFLFAWRTERPPEVQRQIDALNERLRSLEELYPIIGFRVRELLPPGQPILELTPAQWWEHVRIIHRRHHLDCPRLPEAVSRLAVFRAAVRHPLHDPTLLDLTEPIS